MSVARIGEALLPAWARTASVIADTSSTFSGKLQAFLEQSAATARRGFDKHVANILVSLLTPAAVLGLVFGLWRVSADVGWTEEFPITTGFFSHWQVWIALAVTLKFAASSLQARTAASAKTSEEN